MGIYQANANRDEFGKIESKDVENEEQMIEEEKEAEELEIVEKEMKNEGPQEIVEKETLSALVLKNKEKFAILHQDELEDIEIENDTETEVVETYDSNEIIGSENSTIYTVPNTTINRNNIISNPESHSKDSNTSQSEEREDGKSKSNNQKSEQAEKQKAPEKPKPTPSQPKEPTVPTKPEEPTAPKKPTPPEEQDENDVPKVPVDSNPKPGDDNNQPTDPQEVG